MASQNRHGFLSFADCVSVSCLSQIFRAPRVVQHYVDRVSQEWVYEGITDALLFRQVWINAKAENAP